MKWKNGTFTNLIKYDSDGGAGGGTPNPNSNPNSNPDVHPPKDNTIDPKIYDDGELDNVIGGILNIEDRGDLALTMNNVRSTVSAMRIQRDDYKTKYEEKDHALNKANQTIGQLYAQLGQSDTVGEPSGKSNGDTTKTLYDKQREVLG